VWAEQLKRKVRHILVASRVTGPVTHNCDLCVVVALQDTELKALLRLPWSWDISDIVNDGTIYYKGTYKRNGASKLVYAAASPRMGMTAAAVLTTKMICTFRPQYVAMAGITAGIRGSCEIGDIIAADPSWDYGSGKHHLNNGASVFSPAPHQIGLNSLVRGKLGLMCTDFSALAEIREGWRGPKPKSALSMHLGPVASGAAVLQDPSIAADIKQQHRKLVGVEMETYGAFAAVDESPHPQPKAFSLKSVCDFADDMKNDDFQGYAAYTSANALQVFIEKYL
jgi:nucleoside phosphorylase